MELKILETLQFDIKHATALTYLQGMLEASNSDFAVSGLARYLADISLFSFEASTGHTPSKIAAAAVCIATAYFGQVIV